MLFDYISRWDTPTLSMASVLHTSISFKLQTIGSLHGILQRGQNNRRYEMPGIVRRGQANKVANPCVCNIFL